MACVHSSANIQVEPLREACCEHLRRGLAPATAAATLALASRHGCGDLAAAAAGYLEGRLPLLLRELPAAAGLAQLEAETLQGLLESDGLEVESELDVAQVSPARGSGGQRGGVPGSGGLASTLMRRGGLEAESGPGMAGAVQQQQQDLQRWEH